MKNMKNSSWKGPAMILVPLPAQLGTDPNLNHILSLDTSSAKRGLANQLRLTTSLSEGAGWDKPPRAGQRNRAAPASLHVWAPRLCSILVEFRGVGWIQEEEEGWRGHTQLRIPLQCPTAGVGWEEIHPRHSLVSHIHAPWSLQSLLCSISGIRAVTQLVLGDSASWRAQPELPPAVPVTLTSVS